MRHYCTLFDINYLPNFLALYESLTSHSSDFKVYAFCMDNQSIDYLSKYHGANEKNIICISLDQLIAQFPELQSIKLQRSMVEFYFTCSSFICSYIFKNINCSHVTYLDADLFFFDSPEVIFDELGDSSIGIIEHRFYGWGKRFEKYGKYNVGLIIFKNDESGRNCLNSWRDDCTEWCFDFYDKQNERFADQKYLEKWENFFRAVKVINLKGANVAPWNSGLYHFNLRHNKVYVDDSPLLFYHFASFKKINTKVYTTNLSLYFARPCNLLKHRVYKRYLDILEASTIGISELIKKDMKKNRVSLNQTYFKKSLTNTVIKLLRWYYNDYIYK